MIELDHNGQTIQFESTEECIVALRQWYDKIILELASHIAIETDIWTAFADADRN